MSKPRLLFSFAVNTISAFTSRMVQSPDEGIDFIDPISDRYNALSEEQDEMDFKATLVKLPLVHDRLLKM